MNKRASILFARCEQCASSSTRDIQYHGMNVARHQCAMSSIYESHTRHTRVYSCWKYMRFNILASFFFENNASKFKDISFSTISAFFLFPSYIVLAFFCQQDNTSKNIILKKFFFIYYNEKHQSSLDMLIMNSSI